MAMARSGKLTVSYTVICAECSAEVTVTHAADMNDAAKLLREGWWDDKFKTHKGLWYHVGCHPNASAADKGDD